MATNGTLVLNQNYIQTGLGTLTFTVPATIVNGPAVSNVIFNVRCQVTVPSAVASGNGSGSSRDLGLGATGGTQGIGQGSNLSLGNGGTGLGFGGSATDNAAAAITYSAVASGLSVVVKQNGTTVYTAPTITPTQGALQFTTPLLCNAADSITVVFASSTASDETLNAIQANVSIENGN